jgi:hypothetical protein
MTDAVDCAILVERRERRQTQGIVAVSRVEEVEIEIRFGQGDGLERLAALIDFNRQRDACFTRWQRCNFVRDLNRDQSAAACRVG